MPKMTRLNPDRTTYRAPLINGVTCKLDSGPMIACITGTIVDRLGEYEKYDIEPEEIGELLKQCGYKKN